MPTLTVTPNPAPPSTLVAVAGAGFANAKTRLLLDGVGAKTNIFRPRKDGTFNVGITVASTEKTQTLAAQQLGSTWTEKAMSRITVLAAAGGGGTGGGGGYTPPPEPPPSGGTYPSDTTLAYVARPTIPAVPAYLTQVTDPTWGTKITRISNTAGVRHAYARIPAWNSDQSKIHLGFVYPGRMLNGTTYADLYSFSHINGFIWSNTDPNKGYGWSSNGNILYSQNATTGTLTTLRTFTGYSTITIGDYEGGIDQNDTWMALIATTSGGVKHLISYNVATDTILADIVAPAAIDNAQISPLGNYVVVGGSGYTRRYLRSLASYITLTGVGNHGDNALDAAGAEIHVANNPVGGGVVSYLLSSGGAATTLLPAGTAFEYGHVSGRASQRLGWVYLSNYDTVTTAGRSGMDQVVAVKTDGSGTVQVFGFANHDANGSVYAQQPHAVPSRDGTRVLFASKWGATNVYAYVAGLTV